MLALLEVMSSTPDAQTGRRPMPDPLDDVRYYAGRISIAEAQAAETSCLAARHAHEKLATLYRERLDALLQGPLEPDVDEERRA
jgi:hypothetical protein